MPGVRQSYEEKQAMHIVKSTNKYEEWLRRRLSINEEDVQYKHERMADSPFEFMRATFYRWMQLWPEYCKELVSAPEVLTVGDLHTDNFGTWRDIEGRLVWGINDFDEAYPQAYTLDLVRLASSAALALSEDYSSTALPDLCQPILEGYRKGLRAGGAPFVLGQVADDWLLNLIIEMQKEPERFWEKLRELPKFEGELPEGAVAAIGQTLPEPGLRYRVAHRVAGLGSVGRRRFLALMRYGSAFSAREAKELTASAVYWSLEEQGSSEIFYSKILTRAVRCPDPFLRVSDTWAVRRLSPDYVRLDLPELSEAKLTSSLHAMGWETANVHLGSGDKSTRKVLDDLKDKTKNDPEWLSRSAEVMLEATHDDYDDWVNRANNSIV
jgi:Uncharacterized protein conserved in bacteria (DUF2252)